MEKTGEEVGSGRCFLTCAGRCRILSRTRNNKCYSFCLVAIANATSMFVCYQYHSLGIKICHAHDHGRK